jgi:CarD family transcriptional regulator
MPVSKKTPTAARRVRSARGEAAKKTKPSTSAARPTRAATAKPVAARKAAPAKQAAKKATPPKPAKSAAKKPAPAGKIAKAASRKPAKPAAKKPVVKPAEKPAKPAVPKPAVPKPAVPKPAVPKPAPSPFAVGDKVVYPHHGAAVIARKEKLAFQGQRTDYFVLEVATDQLILKVPVNKAVEQGVRPVISQGVARKVLATFKLPPEEAGANWSRWYKLLTEKINSGDIFQVAEVVRDLTFAQQTKGISPALKRMLSKARLILASELRFALDVSEEEAMRRLDKSLPKVEVPEEF